MTSEQKNAIDHAQKILRAVKLYDLAASLSVSEPDNSQAVALSAEQERLEKAITFECASCGPEGSNRARRRLRAAMRESTNPAQNIADTAGAALYHPSLGGVANSANAANVAAGIADTAGAKVVAWIYRDGGKWGVKLGDKPESADEAHPLKFATPPAPSVADAAGASEGQTAMERYVKSGCDQEESDPIERLSFFCSLAFKNPQDWLDVEPFFDAVRKKASEGQASDARLGAFVRQIVGDLADSPKSFLIRVQQAMYEISADEAIEQERRK